MSTRKVETLGAARVGRTTLAFCAAAAFAAAQQSATMFKAPLVVGDGQTSFRCLLDFDGDGHVDALSAWVQSNSPAVGATLHLAGYRNDGAGRLDETWQTLVPLASVQPTAAAKADLNGDGLDDFVLAVGNAVGGWLSNGSAAPATLAWAWLDPAGLMIEDVAVGDFDGDGDDDVAVVGDAFLRLFAPNGAAAPTLLSAQSTGLFREWSLAVANLDDAGPDDLVVGGAAPTASGPTAWCVVLLHVLQPGGLLGTPASTTYPAGHLGVAVGDLNGGGDDYVVTVVSPLGTTATRWVHLRTGPATFSTTSYAASALIGALADLDGDGDLDGLSADVPSTLSSATNSPASVGVALLGPAGSAGTDFTVRALGAAVAGAADLDSDGDVDWVVGRCVYYAGGGTSPPVAHAIGSNLTRRTLDLEGDGDPDFGFAPAGAARNDGAGSFAFAAASIPVPPGASVQGDGFPLDADGDGDVDLLVQTTSAFDTRPRLFRNRGDGVWTDGGFAAAASLSAPATGVVTSLYPDQGVSGDFDGDGDADVALHFGAPPTTQVWRNDGAGYFVHAQTLVAVRPLVAADFDGDGRDDLLARHEGVSPNTLGAYRSTGATFAAPGTALGFAGAATPSVGMPAVADFDGDDDLDYFAAVSSNPAAGASLFANDGSGAFTAGPALSSAAADIVSGATFSAADIDGDGMQDVVQSLSVGSSDAVAAIRRGSGGGAFDAPVVQVVDPSGVADVDGDGDLDFVGLSLVSFNVRFSTPANGYRRQYGAGTAGTGGGVPVLSESGPVRSGGLVDIRVSAVVGGASGILGVGAYPLNQPLLGSTLLAAPELLIPFTADGAPGVAGAGSWAIAWDPPPFLAGAQFFHQAVVADAAGPQGFAWTNGLHLIYGG
jgi:hypothetical protein